MRWNFLVGASKSLKSRPWDLQGIGCQRITLCQLGDSEDRNIYSDNYLRDYMNIYIGASIDSTMLHNRALASPLLLHNQDR